MVAVPPNPGTIIPTDSFVRDATVAGNNTSADIVYNSYAGADIVAEIVLPGEGVMTLGELATISYSMHRENSPVRILGHVNPVSFIRGPRMISGSLIFTMFDHYAFYRLQRARQYIGLGVFPLADMMPPFDVVITFANEYGLMSKMKILGLTIVDEGGTMSIDDLVTEQTFTYMARGIQPMVRSIDASFDPNTASRLIIRP
jgi:hypothetical protein